MLLVGHKSGRIWPQSCVTSQRCAAPDRGPVVGVDFVEVMHAGDDEGRVTWKVHDLRN